MSKTYCRICEAACGLEFVDGKLRPDRAHPVSRGFVCAKGLRFVDVARDRSRLLSPMIREGRALREVGWDDALKTTGARIRAIRARNGPHSVGVYIGNPLAFSAFGQLSALLFAKALGTRNVFTAGSQDCNNKFAGARIMHGSPAIHPIPDFEHADLAVLFGTNPAVSQSSFVHLAGGAASFDRMRSRGAQIVFIDVRETESAKRWGGLLRVHAGSDVWLILALLRRLAGGAIADRRIADHRVQGLDRLLKLARDIPLARTTSMTGLAEAEIHALADRIRATDRIAFHMSVGVNQGRFGTLAYIALQALSYITGDYDRRGGSLFSSLGVGAGRLARRAGLFTRRDRSRIGGFETVFDSLPGGILADEILTPGEDQIRAMVVIAGDPLRSIPGARQLQKAFSSLDTLVCLDLFESRTGELAHVLLPASSWLERADFALPGIALQTVDLLQTTAAMMPRLGQSRADHKVLARLSLAVGRPLLGDLPGARALTSLLGREGFVDGLAPKLSDLVWRLFDRDPERRAYGVRVPAPQPNSYLGVGPLTPGHRVRFWHPDLEGERARLASSAPPAAGFVLLGRRRRIGHGSWLHGGVRAGGESSAGWMAEADMRALGLRDGDRITLTTSQGTLSAPARARPGIAPRTVVFPHGDREVNINELLPAGAAHIEPLSGMLHMTGVPVEVRPAEPQPPLPRENPAEEAGS